MSLSKDARKLMETTRNSTRAAARVKFHSNIDHYKELILQAAGYGKDCVLLREPDQWVRAAIREWAAKEGFTVRYDIIDPDIMWLYWGALQ